MDCCFSGGVAAGSVGQQGQSKKRIGLLIPFAQGDSEAKAQVTAFLGELERLGWSDGGMLRSMYAGLAEMLNASERAPRSS
jgi:hypothetical protein